MIESSAWAVPLLVPAELSAKHPSSALGCQDIFKEEEPMTLPESCVEGVGGTRQLFDMAPPLLAACEETL